MKLLFENWRKFLNEKKWEDYDHKKDSWQDIPPSEIESAKTKEDKDLADELFSLIDTAYKQIGGHFDYASVNDCLLYTSPSPRDRQKSRMPSSA